MADSGRYEVTKRVERDQHERSKSFEKTRKQAREAAQKVYAKFQSGRKPYSVILEKMMKYKTENKWTDAEYDEFRKELGFLLTGSRASEIDYNQTLDQYKSRINKTLGSVRSVQDEGLQLMDSEKAILAEIISMHQKADSLHKQVYMQSLLYEDCSIVAMSGEYDRKKNTASNHIHPLLAALFLPKLDLFEIHMLYSNIGSIVKTRSEKKQIVDHANALVYYDLISDPNDVVCEISSPLTDLRNRFRVQIALWETVLKLRNGQYYDASPMADFNTHLNQCRNNLYDSADLAFNQDEGTMLRRLLSVFSIRPTIIKTSPLYDMTSFANPLAAMGLQGHPGLQFVNQPTYTITQIPMLTLRLPPMPAEGQPAPNPVDLKDAVQQNLWLNEKGMIVPKTQSVIYSKEVLIFYVNRHVQRIQIRSITNPIAFSQLPLTMSGFDHLNSYPVSVPHLINIRSDDSPFMLRSVVAVSQTAVVQATKTTSVITGSTALIASLQNPLSGQFVPSYYLYDPFGASMPIHDAGDDKAAPKVEPGYFFNKPVSEISFMAAPTGAESASFLDRASKAGTIFIYAKNGSYRTNEMIQI